VSADPQPRSARHPAKAAPPPKQPHRELHTWTAEQLRQFPHTVDGERLYAAWRLGALTGMRRGELLGLRWSDLDLDAGWLSVRQALVVVDRQVQVSQPKTARGRRLIALDPGTVAMTLDIYSHAIPALQQDAATTIADLIGGQAAAAGGLG
jgi:integrase